MSISTSPSTGKIYGLKRVCSVWKIARSTVYERRRRTRSKAVKQKPGPKPKISDESLLQAVRQDIKDSLFHGEGHKKIHARLRRHKGICVGRNRVLKLMRKNNLLSPYRYVQEKAKKHDGRITTDNPNVLWGTDATKILTVDDGWVWFFGLIEHWNAECMGWYMAKKGDRFVAIEALQQAIRAEYGSIGRGVAQGLQVRPDHGPQFTSDDFLKQLRYWGITPSPSLPLVARKTLKNPYF